MSSVWAYSPNQTCLKCKEFAQPKNLIKREKGETEEKVLPGAYRRMAYNRRTGTHWFMACHRQHYIHFVHSSVRTIEKKLSPEWDIKSRETTEVKEFFDQQIASYPWPAMDSEQPLSPLLARGKRKVNVLDLTRNGCGKRSRTGDEEEDANEWTSSTTSMLHVPPPPVRRETKRVAEGPPPPLQSITQVTLLAMNDRLYTEPDWQLMVKREKSPSIDAFKKLCKYYIKQSASSDLKQVNSLDVEVKDIPTKMAKRVGVLINQQILQFKITDVKKKTTHGLYAILCSPPLQDDDPPFILQYVLTFANKYIKVDLVIDTGDSDTEINKIDESHQLRVEVSAVCNDKRSFIPEMLRLFFPKEAFGPLKFE